MTKHMIYMCDKQKVPQTNHFAIIAQQPPKIMSADVRNQRHCADQGSLACLTYYHTGKADKCRPHPSMLVKRGTHVCLYAMKKLKLKMQSLQFGADSPPCACLAQLADEGSMPTLHHHSCPACMTLPYPTCAVVCTTPTWSCAPHCTPRPQSAGCNSCALPSS